MVPKVNALQALIKTAAISGIVLVWVNFSVEAFKMAWHIISTSPEKETWKAVSKVMCAECRQFFIDKSDENETYICCSCAGFTK